MRVHEAGFKNVMMPAFWVGTLACVLLLSAAIKRWRKPWLMVIIGVLVLVQVRLELWDYSTYQPAERDWEEAGEQLLRFLGEQQGEVFMPEFAWYPALVGKKPSVHLMSLWDIQSEQGPFARDARAFELAYASHPWPVVITSLPGGFGKEFREHYKRVGRLPRAIEGLETRTGYRVAPRWIWRPNP
jgi:hypothetical protein